MAKEVTTKQLNLPMTPDQEAELEEMMRSSAGAGISNKAEDNLIPQISVLQPLSPEVLEGPARIEGAKAGDFLIGDNFVSGSDGIWFQPCAQNEIWLEFTPLAQGGGFVAQHVFVNEDTPPPGAQRREKNRFVMANGNEVIHYRQWAGLMWDNGVGLEHVINFKSTGHSIAKKWMTKANQADRLADGRPLALYSHIYHLTTSMRQNSSGRWYVIDVGPAIKLGKPESRQAVHDPFRAMAIGEALHHAFENLEKRAAVTAESPSEPRRVMSAEDIGKDDEIPF